MTKTILMIAPQPFFEERGTPFSVLGRLRALSHLGHAVDLLTYPVGQDVTLPGVTIHRIAALPFLRDIPIGPSRVKVVLDILLFYRAFRMLRKRRYDLLHTHEEASFFGVLLAKWFRVPHLYDMHSSLPQQLENFRYSRFRPLIDLFAWLERRVINTSDALITICPALEAHVKSINRHVPHVMIENVASGAEPIPATAKDTDSFKTIQRWSAARKVILYTGTFEAYQGLDLLLDSAERVLRQRQDVGFLLVGGKPEQVQHYRHLVQQRGLSTYFCLPGVRPRHEMPLFFDIARTLVSPRISGTNTPLKIYGYLQSGKPIVATDLPTHTQVLNAEVAVLVAPDADAMAAGILAAVEETPDMQGLGQRAQQMFDTHYHFKAFVQKTDQVLQMALR